MTLPRNAVPCNGCVRCCRADAVRLLPGDIATLYQTEPHPYMPGELMLAHKANLDCIYLGEKGCTIHERAPRQCREMDCRVIAKKIKFEDLRRYGQRVEVWRKGKELLGETK